MITKNITEQIKLLRQEIAAHDRAYFDNNAPSIPDTIYDAKKEKLIALEAQHPSASNATSPTQQIGERPTKNFAHGTHKYRMLSLNNAYSANEIQDFDKRVNKWSNDAPQDYVCEQKIDGIAISLYYENKQLTQATTRGDGQVGDIITENVRTIQDIPQHITDPSFPDKLEIRGEIYMKKSTFERINQARLAEELPPYANARNVAAGTLKLLSTQKVAQRDLHCACYEVCNYNLLHSINLTTHIDVIEQLQRWKLPVFTSYAHCQDVTSVLAYINKWSKHHEDLPMHTDGVVIKVNNLSIRTKLGNTAKSPRWAIAFKYPSEVGTARLQSITYSVGRTGAITPTANFSPVILAGTTVQNASLYNFDEIDRLNLQLGDLIYVEKAGEIIPKITGVDHAARTQDQPLALPTHCPSCQTLLVRQADGIITYCPNTQSCQAQRLEQFIHFVQRNAMNIEALGPETLKGLSEAGLVQDVADLYSLTKERLLGFTIQVNAEKTRTLQEKSVENLLNSLNASKKQPLHKVLFALGIRYIGATVAKKIAQYFKHMQAIQQATFDELVGIYDIGEKAAQSLVSYFAHEPNQMLINRLAASGLQMKDMTTPTRTTALSGKRVVISGTFDQSRHELQTQLEQLGAQCQSTVSNKTDFILCGKNMGESKRKKAEELNISLLTETDFRNMIL